MSCEIKLKRLCQKGNSGKLIQRFIDDRKEPLCIFDHAGELILGESKEITRHPIEVGDEAIGWVCGEQLDAQLLAAFISYMAQKELESKMLSQETLSKYKELTLLYELGGKIANCVNITELAQLALIEAKALLPSGKDFHLGILLADQEEGHLSICAGEGEIFPVGAIWLSIDGITQQVLSTGNVEIVNDVPNDLRFLACSGLLAGIEAMLCTPMRTRDKTFGVLNIVSRTPISFSAAEAKVINLLASQVAIAIGRIHLIDDRNEIMRQEMRSRKKAEKYEYFRSHTLEMLTDGSCLSNVLSAIVLGVEQLNSAMRCSIWLLDNEGKYFIRGIAPSLPEFYITAFEGLEIRSKIGAFGMAVSTGELVIIEDITTHSYYDSLEELVVSAKLGSCWSQPIISSSGQVLGAFSIYLNAIQAPNESDIYLIEQSARLAGIAIEFKEAEEQLKEAHGHINSELEIARNLQIDILPAFFPVANGCDGSARMLPATTMGGDFYDFIELPDGKLGLVMADVSGKGVPAAFFMAVARTNLRLIAYDSSGPGECLRRTNDVLCTQNPMYLFVTVFYAVFDPSIGLLTYANGGHNPPVFRRADGSIKMLGSLGDSALGVIEEISFKEHIQQFSPGDSLILYTDGVTEAFNPNWEEHGEERMLEQVRIYGNGDAKSLVAAIFDSVIGFAETAPQSDDITITVLKWQPPMLSHA